VDLSFTPEQEALRGLAREVLRAATTPERLARVDVDPDRFDRALWAELARADLLGVGIPEEAGGVGGGMVELCLVLEEAGAAAAPVPLLETLVLGAQPIVRHGGGRDDSLLEAVVAGEAVLAAALVEPDGADPLRPTTAATADGPAWRLEGVKTVVPAARLARRVLVPAAEPAGAGLFLVDPAGPGVALEPQRVTSGEPVFRMTLASCRVEAEGALVPPGARPEALPDLVDRALVGLAALQVGHAEAALRMTAEHLRTREQFGRPLGRFQAVQQRMADCYIDLEAMRWTMWQAAWRLDAGLPAAEEVAIAKFWAADGGHRILAAAQHLHGGLGADVSYPLHRYTLRGKHVELLLGGATRQLARLGALMAGEAG
jgi:alkylation response protein AidB-like acyl-CoA dehydrogenase